MASLPVFQAVGQDFPMPDNPLRGRIVFEQKGCSNCHAIQGEGGQIGPDLGQRKFYGSFLELAGIMWNHSPEMFRRMRELELPYPEFTATEMGELIAYLYYLRYLGEPGDLNRGKVLVNEKGCLACHSIAGKGGKTGPAFDKLGKYVSPIYMAQAMWNHGPEMGKRIKAMGLQRPKFQRGEIVDLSAYIRQASRAGQQEKVYMSPGNPQKGEALFKTKGCATCHSETSGKTPVAPDLSEVQLDVSVTEIAGLMWNHGSEMSDLMAEMKIAWPSFTSREMADVLAYIYFLRFAGKPGDATPEKRFSPAKAVRIATR
jgi:cytochrome c551/c552